jgi:hypothetical protein
MSGHEDAKLCTAEKKKGDACFYAGNVLAYQEMANSKTKKNEIGCPRPDAFCLDTFEATADPKSCKGKKLTCKKTAGGQAVSGGGSSEAAEGKMALCNPLLFGVAKNGDALCVPAGTKESASKATRSCYELAYKNEHSGSQTPQSPGSKAPSDGQGAAGKDGANIAGGIGGKGGRGGATDNGADKDLSIGNTAAKEGGYKKIKDAVEKICNSTDKKTAGNCRACNAARSRIVAMNSNFVKDSKLEDIKIGEIPKCQTSHAAAGANGAGASGAKRAVVP